VESYAGLFEGRTGKPFSKKKTDFRSDEEIDEYLFETVSRLFFEDRDTFYFLKEKAEKAAKGKKQPIFYSAIGYFYYVDCDFGKAIKYFKKSIQADPFDLETWFSLAFCYRQNGEYGKFDSIMCFYADIINGINAKRSNIESSILEYAKKCKYNA